MVKKSKKSKSKRVPLKKKYKIIRKVKEHHKKKAKEAKKLGGSHKRKVEKDPGIPNDWPFKEQELQALEARRARALEELEQKKAARKERAQKRKLGLLEADDTASAKDEKFEGGKVTEASTGPGKNRDNSDRAFYKELVEVIEASDVILEVLDARDPLGTRCVDMEKMVMRSGPNKHLVLLLNKIDLVPREAVEKWLKYLREELPAVAFKCSTQEQRTKLGWRSKSKAAKPSNILQTSDCLGAETLIKLLKNYSRSHEIKKSITVGVIGLPNVGKSSLINSLKRSHVVNVGATPGLTRSRQEVHLDKNVKLLDCPGVVMLKSGGGDSSIALRNCKRIEKLDDTISPVKEILKLCPAKLLVTLYKIPSFDSVDDFLQKVATLRGKLKKGGVVDTEAAARIVLHDWNQGKIPYYTMPPSRDQGEKLEATIVSELGKEFNIDEVYNSESSFIGSLKSADDFHTVEIPPNSPLGFDEKMLEEFNIDEVYNSESSFIGSLKSADDFHTVEIPPNSPLGFDEKMLEGNVQPQPSTQEGQEDKEVNSDGDDESMGIEDDAGQTKAKTVGSRQNEKLYTAEGILNPNLKRAEKKRRKRAGKTTTMEADDYDFKVDYKKKDSAMDNCEESGDDDGEAPMAGVEFD